MRTYLATGWRAAVRHRYVIVLLFLYQLLWGFAIYRMAEGVIRPLLLRYPGVTRDSAALERFLYEAQFRLLKTDLAQPYLWGLLLLLLLRMAVSPLINAGLYYSLRRSGGNGTGASGGDSSDREGGGTLFLEGIRKVWKPVMLLYWLEALLALAPALRLVPRSAEALVTGLHNGSWPGPEFLPYAAGWLIWCFAVHLVFFGLQLGIAGGDGLGTSLPTSLRRLLPMAGVAVVMGLIGAGLGAVSSAVSLVWAGLFALILHQGFHFVRVFVKVWCAGAVQAAFLHGKER